MNVLALVGDWLSWLPTHATWAGIVAGPLVIIGYLVGSVPFPYLLSRRRLRRQLDSGGSAHLAPGRSSEDPLDMPGAITAAALSAAATLLLTTIAWDIGLQVAPRGSISAVGTYANQAVGAWVSIALWTGAGAVVGHAASVWTSFRGGSGVPPAVAITAAYLPLLFVAGAAVFLLSYALSRSPRLSLLVTLPAVVAIEYVAWIADLQAGWGITNGPEVALWTAVVAGVLAARNLRTAPSSPAP